MVESIDEDAKHVLNHIMVKHTAVKPVATQNHTKKSCDKKGSRAKKLHCKKITANLQ